MTSLRDKIVLIGLLGVLVFAGTVYKLLNLTFFWAKYIELLILLIMSVIGVIVVIVRSIIEVVKQKKDNNTGYGGLKTWVCLQEERKRQKKVLVITCLLCILIAAFGVWIGSVALKEVVPMTKDIPYVLNKNYSKVQGFVEANGSSYQSGCRHYQYITAINKVDNEYVFINFEHKYEKIDEGSKYVIWYLPNTKLGVSAQKIP